MRAGTFLFSILIGFAAEAAWKSAGSAQLYFRQYSFSQTEDVPNKNGGLNANFKLDWSNRKALKVRSDLDLRTDSFSKDSKEKFQFNPRQFFFEADTASIQWRAGYQTIIPEGPDFLNPADVIHSKSWIDPISPDHLSSLGLSVSQEVDVFHWEVFYIPKQTTAILPGERSPWWPREKRLPIESDDMELQIPDNVQYRVTDSVELNEALRNNFAFRFQVRAESFESQFVYYEGLAQEPYLLADLDATLIATTPQLVLLLNSPVHLRPLYFKQRVLAGTFMIPFESWALRGGANWIKPLSDDSRVPGESGTGVLGVEKSFETRKGLVTLILQHAAQKRQAKNQISFLRSIYENAWSFGFRVPWGDEIQFLGGVIFDTVGKSSVYRVGSSIRLTDSWTSELEANLLDGPEDTLLGLYKNHDRFGIGFTFHW